MSGDHQQRIEAERRGAILDAVRTLAKRKAGMVSVQEYQRYRREEDPQLPSLTEVYRLFSAWPEVISQAGIPSPAPARKRTSQEDLVAALVHVAHQLGVSVLSSHAYDDYRSRCEEPLPSSSVIRKWLKSWEDAVAAAGLQSPRRSLSRRYSAADIQEALREAMADCGEQMSHDEYEAWAATRREDGRDIPNVSHIIQHFPSFEGAMQSTEVERNDDIHPHTLWTTEEARRIGANVATLTGALTRENYRRVTALARRPMPDWDTLAQLLDLEG